MFSDKITLTQFVFHRNIQIWAIELVYKRQDASNELHSLTSRAADVQGHSRRPNLTVGVGDMWRER